MLARTWWIYALALMAVAVGAVRLLRPNSALAKPLDGYLLQSELLDKEYRRFYGKAMRLPDAESGFRSASAMMLKRDYAGAVSALEQVVKETAVPSVYNNLGVLYAQMNDRGRAVNAFREALSRDADYRPVRDNLDRLRSYLNNSAAPVTHEIEPNNTVDSPNLIPLNEPVEAELTADRDQDVFKFIAPSAPRDILAVEIANHSPNLVLGLRIYDDNMLPAGIERTLSSPGAPLTLYFSPPVNKAAYLKIWGVNDTAGKYVLTVKALHAPDSFEPNDDVFNSSRIAIGTAIDAGIMDSADTDVYSFVAPRTGFVEIEIHNRSVTLVPALTTYGPDQRTSGFGPEVRVPGSDLKHRLEVEANKTYYLQVWAQNSSSGNYTLTVR